MAAGGASHRHLFKACGLNQDAGGRVGHLGRGAAHHTGQADYARIIGNHDILGVQGTLHAVQGHQLLTGHRAAHHDFALNLIGIVEVQGLTGLQHHVVGDIDGQRQRAHTGQTQTRGHPGRNRGLGLHAGYLAHHEAHATRITVNRGIVAQGHRVTGLVLLRGALAVRQHKILKGRTGSVAPLASNTTQRECVTAVRGHVHLGRLIVQAQQLHRIGAKLRIQAQGREHQNTAVIIANTQLAGRGNHASRLVAVGLAGGNRETAGQHGAGQGHDDLVTGLEIVGAADDTLHAGGLDALAGQGLLLTLRNHAHLAPVHGLAVGVGLGFHRENLAHHNRARHLVGGAVNVFFFQTNLHQGCHQIFSRSVLGDRHELAQP